MQSFLETKAQKSSLLKFLSGPMILLFYSFYEKNKVSGSFLASRHQNEILVLNKIRTNLLFNPTNLCTQCFQVSLNPNQTEVKQIRIYANDGSRVVRDI